MEPLKFSKCLAAPTPPWPMGKGRDTSPDERIRVRAEQIAKLACRVRWDPRPVAVALLTNRRLCVLSPVSAYARRPRRMPLSIEGRARSPSWTDKLRIWFSFLVCFAHGATPPRRPLYGQKCSSDRAASRRRPRRAHRFSSRRN